MNCTKKNGFCSNLDCQNCLSRSFASSKRVGNLLPNQGDPRRIPLRGGKLLGFECGDCNHKFEARGDKVNATGKTNPTWCPYCGGKKLCDNDCQTCFDKSFASFEDKKKLACFSKDNVLTPRQIRLFCNDPMKFTCDECGHDFMSKISNVTKLGRWCKYCENQGFCEDDRCQHCFNNSIVSDERIMTCWSKKNEDVDPKKITKGSPTTKIWLDCDICDHTFYANVGHITNPTKPTWCPYCSDPPRQMCDLDDNCSTCYNKSFASHPRAKFWSPKNKMKPEVMFKGSCESCWFDCEDCLQCFKMRLYHVTRPLNARWCPNCTNKTEAKLFSWLNERYPSTFEIHVKYDWLTDGTSNFEYDFICEHAKLIIELDGDQHFTSVKNWTPLEITESRDIFKMKKAKEMGYSMIRILQMDVYYDRTDWKADLEKHIQKYDEPTFVFLSNGDHYEKMEKGFRVAEMARDT